MELVLSSPPVNVSLENVPIWEGKESYRIAFLQDLENMIFSPRGELTRAQERYKASFHKAVRLKNQHLKKDDPVLLRVEVHGAGRSKKLERQAHGPLYVERND